MSSQRYLMVQLVTETMYFEFPNEESCQAAVDNLMKANEQTWWTFDIAGDTVHLRIDQIIAVQQTSRLK